LAEDLAGTSDCRKPFRKEVNRNPKRMPLLIISKPEVERSGSDGETEE
jgi:hypothetical protein